MYITFYLRNRFFAYSDLLLNISLVISREEDISRARSRCDLFIDGSDILGNKALVSKTLFRL